MTKNSWMCSSLCFLAIGALSVEKRNAVQAQEAKPSVETVTDRTSPVFRKAEAEFVSASVMLLGNEGPDAQRKTFERFQDYLTKREKIEFIYS